MSDALAVANRFYQATNELKDVELTATLIGDDMRFTGPVIQTSGAGAYLNLLRLFLPTHVETRMTTQFARGDDVCSIYDLVQRAPAGGHHYARGSRLDPGVGGDGYAGMLGEMKSHGPGSAAVD